MLAETPQIYSKHASCLRKFRKCLTNKHNPCGNSANIKQKCNIFAELPQARCRKKRIFAESKRSQTETKSIQQHINALNAI